MHDATCKALEVALGERKDAFNKRDEKIKKKEVGGKVGVGRRRRGRGVEVVVEGMNQGVIKTHGMKQNKYFMPSLT
jgi:hypothetical protein